MQSPEPHMQIARRIQSVEQAKIALIDQVGTVFRGLQSGSERELTEALGQLVAVTFYLGALMDIPPETIERQISSVPKSLTQDALDLANFEPIRRYFGSKR